MQPPAQRVGRSLVYDGRQTLAELSRNTVCSGLFVRTLCGAGPDTHLAGPAVPTC